MVTVTYPWWVFFLFFFFLVPTIRIAEWSGDKLGHAIGRWWVKRRDAKQMNWHG